MARMIQPPKRRPGRPRLGDVRIEITVPKAMVDVLMAREQQTNVYRTPGLPATFYASGRVGRQAKSCARITRSASDALAYAVFSISFVLDCAERL